MARCKECGCKIGAPSRAITGYCRHHAYLAKYEKKTVCSLFNKILEVLR